MLLNCGAREDFLIVPWIAMRSNQSIFKESILNIHWKDWYWSGNSNTFATWCEELTHWIRPWLWERLKAGGEGENRRQHGWMTSLTQWTWVWVSFRSWCWTGKPDMESQSRTRLSDWTELTVFQSVFTNLWLSAFWNLGFFSQSTVIAYNSLVYLSLTTNDIEHSVTYHVYMDILCFEVDILIFKYDIFPISIPLSVTFWLIPKYSLYILCKCILRVLQLFFLYHGSLHFA